MFDSSHEEKIFFFGLDIKMWVIRMFLILKTWKMLKENKNRRKWILFNLNHYFTNEWKYWKWWRGWWGTRGKIHSNSCQSLIVFIYLFIFVFSHQQIKLVLKLKMLCQKQQIEHISTQQLIIWLKNKKKKKLILRSQNMIVQNPILIKIISSFFL
jgi:hypothetical protein